LGTQTLSPQFSNRTPRLSPQKLLPKYCVTRKRARGQVLQSRIQIARLSSFVVLLTAGGIGIVANHLTMTKADRDLVEKFGAPYREYMNQVPR